MTSQPPEPVKKKLPAIKKRTARSGAQSSGDFLGDILGGMRETMRKVPKRAPGAADEDVLEAATHRVQQKQAEARGS